MQLPSFCIVCIIIPFRVIYSLFAIPDSVIFLLDKFPDNGTSVRFTAHRMHLSRDTRKTVFQGLLRATHFHSCYATPSRAARPMCSCHGKSTFVDLDAVNL